MKRQQKKVFAVLLATALLMSAAGCSERQPAAVEPPSGQSAASVPASTSAPDTGSEPQELYSGGQEDPTIIGFPKARWEHIEYKNFGSPDNWETARLKAWHYENGVETGDPLLLTLKLPERVTASGTFDYDGDFAKGNIKIGDGFSSFVPLPPGETAANNTNEDYSIEHFRGHPLSGELYTMTETDENVVGGYCYGGRGDISFARYAGGGASPDNTMLQYVVQLGDSYLTEAYFYVSENATSEDLKIYDEIILSVMVKE